MSNSCHSERDLSALLHWPVWGSLCPQRRFNCLLLPDVADTNDRLAEREAAKHAKEKATLAILASMQAIEIHRLNVGRFFLIINLLIYI